MNLKKKKELCPQSFVELICDCTSVQVLIVLTAFHHHPLSYMLYEFPLLSHCLGLGLSVLPIVPVPAYAVWSVWKKEGSIKNVSPVFLPTFKYLSYIEMPEQNYLNGLNNIYLKHSLY